jgi:hypothetical protein
MGCLGIGLAALLALAVPASIARASLVGAYVVIALLALAAVGAVVWADRHRDRTMRISTALVRIGLVTVAYAVVVTLINAAA